MVDVNLWPFAMVLCVIVVCITVIFVSLHPMELHFSADENVVKVGEHMANVAALSGVLSCLDGCFKAQGYISEECYAACIDAEETIDSYLKRGVVR